MSNLWELEKGNKKETIRRLVIDISYSIINLIVFVNLTLYTAGRHDAGIERAAQGLVMCFLSCARLPEIIEVLNRALNALSDRAASERASLQAHLALPSLASAGLSDSWRKIEEATATAEQLADPALLARVLTFKAAWHRQCLELEASLETGHRALAQGMSGVTLHVDEERAGPDLGIHRGGGTAI